MASKEYYQKHKAEILATMKAKYIPKPKAVKELLACNLTLAQYNREIEQCRMADIRMKEIDRKIASMTPAEQEARRNRIEADRHVVRQGTNEWLALMTAGGLGDEPWVVNLYKKYQIRQARRNVWLNSEINALPCLVK